MVNKVTEYTVLPIDTYLHSVLGQTFPEKLPSTVASVVDAQSKEYSNFSSSQKMR